MANTTNFGWETPDDTDLVKDGAAAIRTLGSAIDTSLGDLEGGTTGQILAKNSNTDMDFVWITNDVGDITAITASSPLTGGGTTGAITVGIQDGTTAQKGAVQLENSTSSTSTTTAAVPASVKSAYDLANAAIPKTLTTTTGDVIYASSANTPARLGIGSTGNVLTVSGGLPVWAAPATSSSGLTLIQRSTFSNVANTGTTFDGVFTSTYKTYQIIIENMSASTAADDLHLQLRYSGTTQAAGYSGNSIQLIASSSTTTNANATGQSQILLGTRSSNSGEPSTGHFYIQNVGTSSGLGHLTGTLITPDNGEAFLTFYVATTARTYTGLLFKSSSSNISGTVAIYGLA